MSQCLVVPNPSLALSDHEFRFTYRVTGGLPHNFDWTPNFAQNDTTMRAAFLTALQAAVLASDAISINAADCIVLGLPTSLLPDVE